MPSALPAADAAMIPALSTSSGPSRNGPAAGDSRAARRRRSGTRRGTLSALSRPSAAAPTNTTRQPNGSATSGTASPPSRVLNGIAACLAPNATPWCSGGTHAAMSAFDAGCPNPLAAPATSSAAVSTGNSSATAPITSSAAVDVSAAARTARVLPESRPVRPASTEASAELPKKPATSAPSVDGAKPTSPRTCTTSTPSR